MKKHILIIALLIVVSLMLAACTDGNSENGDATVNPETGLTAFTSTDTTGATVDQSVFENHKLTMVNIWATFCSPCIEEMPDLAELNEDYSAEDFQVVGIVADAKEGDAGELEAALSIIEQTEANYMHILASESLNAAKLSSVQYVPETIFVDALGNQVGESYVGARDYDAWSEIIEDLLKMVE
ncbi:MAG: TlpA family protein disulfide reductase [Clostridia bacterium]|nr:TlpA family protein disulfide reductase [Clostridia bacterium]